MLDILENFTVKKYMTRIVSNQTLQPETTNNMGTLFLLLFPLRGDFDEKRVALSRRNPLRSRTASAAAIRMRNPSVITF